jgi:hypothetical protein
MHFHHVTMTGIHQIDHEVLCSVSPSRVGRPTLSISNFDTPQPLVYKVTSDHLFRAFQIGKTSTDKDGIERKKKINHWKSTFPVGQLWGLVRWDVWWGLARPFKWLYFKPEPRAYHVSQPARERWSPSLRSLAPTRAFPRARLGFRMVFRWKKTQDLKGEPIDALNQTKPSKGDRKTFNAHLRNSRLFQLWVGWGMGQNWRNLSEFPHDMKTCLPPIDFAIFLNETDFTVVSMDALEEQ